jgi:peptidoglycan L-alanyl-D-glutamate endopeptidase CwlK
MFENDTLFLQRFLKSLGYYTGKLDGIYGPLTDAAVNAFDDKCDEIAGRIGRFDKRSESRIVTLHPKAQEKAREFLKELKGANFFDGVVVKIISGTRTYAEQAEIYAQGRTKPGRIVTKAGPGRSNHNFGTAWDVGLFNDSDYLDDSPLYKEVGKVGKSLGLEWGGDWRSIIDEPHFQLPTEYNMTQVRERFEEGIAYV